MILGAQCCRIECKTYINQLQIKGTQMSDTTANFSDYPKAIRWLATLGLVILAASLAACGSTKVYTADKTVVYKDAVYNVSNVRIFKPINQAVLADKSTVELKGMDKKAFNALLDKEKSVFVRQGFLLDQDELVYQATNVDSWNDFNKMNKRFSSAGSSLTKFLGDKKKTQLKLK
jgi:hypothetical protein